MKRQQPQEQINSDIKEKRFLSFLFFYVDISSQKVYNEYTFKENI